MASFTIEEIERACGAKLLKRGREPSMDGVSTDTRTIETGNLFLALKGENFDGHAFLKKACEEGASGVILSDASFAAEVPSDVSAFASGDGVFNPGGFGISQTDRAPEYHGNT